MSVFHLISLIEPAVGLGVALIASVILTRRRSPELTSRRVLVAVVGVVVLAAVLVVRAWLSHPWFQLPMWGWDPTSPLRMAHYLLPLVAGVILVVVVGWPARGRHAPGRATLERRGILTFTRRWWLVGIVAVLVVSGALAIAAGLASSPNEDGYYTNYVVPAGGGYAAGTSIYGWHFSLPSGIATLVLLAVAVLALTAVARFPIRVDPELADTIRHHRARDVASAAAGALVLHLGAVLGSLGGTASLTLTFSTTTGMITIVTPFAAIGPALGVAGQVATVVGFALWWFVVLAAIRARRVPVAG